jgi:hypothetical protein
MLTHQTVNLAQEPPGAGWPEGLPALSIAPLRDFRAALRVNSQTPESGLAPITRAFFSQQEDAP